MLFEPRAGVSLSYHTWTRRHLIIVMLADVKSRIDVLTPPTGAATGESPGDARRDGFARDATPPEPTGERTRGGAGWRRRRLPTAPDGAHGGAADIGAADIVGADPDHSDEYWLDLSGFTQPATLLRGQLSDPGATSDPGETSGPDARLETVRQAPAFFQADGLAVRQHFAVSRDGTRVPYFIVGPQESPADGSGRPANPTLLTGYGGFEVPLTPSYSGVIGRGWLARGGTYVVANIHGGGEYGPAWHQSALRENRFRVFEDFAAVARDLVHRGVTSPRRLGVQGGSNGGLLTGVMLTRRPELFGAVVSQVPLLDMRRYHTLLAGASWMIEYGDPDDPADWAYLREYSPYHNVRSTSERRYPPTLLFTSTRDDRVHPGHARKMTARLRQAGQDVRYYENIEGGHGAAADNQQQAFKWALIFEFLWRTLSH